MNLILGLNKLEIYKIINPTKSDKITINTETAKKEIFEDKKNNELNKIRNWNQFADSLLINLNK